MSWVYLFLLIVLTLPPLVRAWWGHRGTPLAQAIVWASVAVASWFVLWGWWIGAEHTSALDYLALCLTACPVVALLGARRPIHHAWAWVVLGFLGVLLLPLGDVLLSGQPRYEWLGLSLLAGAFLIGTVNYLPTCFWPAALCFGLGSGLALAALSPSEWQAVGWMVLSISPIVAGVLAAWRFRGRGEPDCDQLWQDFRDCFGLIWGQRVRELFNTAAANAGWGLRLGWWGLEPAQRTLDEERAALELLRALLKRFGREEVKGPEH